MKFSEKVLNKKFILPLLLLLVISAGYFLYGQKKINRCLSGDQFAEYVTQETRNGSDIAIITVKSKITNKSLKTFQVDIINANHYHPVEIHRCGVYAVKSFNYDYENKTSLPGYQSKIWRYDYQNSGEPLVTIAEDPLGDLKSLERIFNSDFRVNPAEDYIVLIKSYFGETDYALIFKNLGTKNDDFIFPITKIAEKDSELVANIQLIDWAKDGRYFWARTHAGANTLAFIRIDSQDWSYEIFEAPQSTMGGDALNLEKGMTTVHPGNIWIGVHELTEQEKERRKQEGIGSEMHIYNLFTKENIEIAETDEPLYFFKPNWISDTQLQYELPDGEVKIYTL